MLRFGSIYGAAIATGTLLGGLVGETTMPPVWMEWAVGGAVLSGIATAAWWIQRITDKHAEQTRELVAAHVRAMRDQSEAQNQRVDEIYDLNRQAIERITGDFRASLVALSTSNQNLHDRTLTALERATTAMGQLARHLDASADTSARSGRE